MPDKQLPRITPDKQRPPVARLRRITPDKGRPPAAWLPRTAHSPLIRSTAPPTWPSLTSSSRTISSPRRISTACTISFPLVLTATRSVMQATGITGAAVSGAQAGTIGGSDGAAGPVRSSGRSYSVTSAPSPSGRTVITIRSGPLVRISFLSASSLPDLISGPTTGTRQITPDIGLLPTSITVVIQGTITADMQAAIPAVIQAAITAVIQ